MRLLISAGRDGAKKKELIASAWIASAFPSLQAELLNQEKIPRDSGIAHSLLMMLDNEWHLRCTVDDCASNRHMPRGYELVLSSMPSSVAPHFISVSAKRNGRCACTPHSVAILGRLNDVKDDGGWGARAVPSRTAAVFQGTERCPL